jgi:Raf kinase inhibitor-like YbhB/YbcL family protein
MVWVTLDIPPDTKSLPENAGKVRSPQGALLGLNNLKKTGYSGPSPPIGRHRYFHKLYALDITLDLRDATKSQVERAMQGTYGPIQNSSARIKRVTGSHGMQRQRFYLTHSNP